MDKNELERRLEAAEKQNIGLLDEIKYLKEQLAQMQDEPEIPEIPEFARNETYWYVGSDLNDAVVGRAVGTYADDYNVFHTKEYADEFAQKCKLIAMMLHCKWHLCRDFIPEWSENAPCKFAIYYSHEENKFKVDDVYMVEENDVFFDTEENAQKAADWLNKHWKENENE